MSDLRERIYQRTGFSNVELDAVIAVVGPLVEQLRQAEVSRDAYRDERDATQRERDQLLTERSAWEQRLSDVQEEHRKHAESWDRTRERLTRERAELRWLHAEAVWRRDQFRANEVENAELANDIFMAAGSKLASAVVLPEDWLHLVERAIAEADGLGPVTVDAATGAIETLIDSWRPGAAAPRTGTDWCLNCQKEAGTDRFRDGAGTERCATCGSELADAAGVSGTGTEAAPLADLPEAQWREFHEGALSARSVPAPAVDRDTLAALFRAAPGKVRLGDQTPGEIARRLLARYDIRERGDQS